MWGVTQRKWYGYCSAAVALIALGAWNFDYSFSGVILMLIFYFCRNKPVLGALLFCLSYLSALWGSPSDPLALMIGGHAVDWTIFSLFAAPLIFCPTHTGVKMNKWFFYIFYPAHLAVIALIKVFLV